MKGLWQGAWSDGSKEWNREVIAELNHQFGSDSVFWITFEDFIEKYQVLNRTRLFSENDWRCCQRWIGVEVPWKPQWNEKFHIKLTTESPIVLVLQQLDDRYWRGLIGQYRFKLHFRVHEQGKPHSEDYIVRSHNNYFLDRSTTVELPYMQPGSYSVWICVEAIRSSWAQPVEEVVKHQCASREDNEKLAKVGYAYDLAHSKGIAHLEHVNKLRKQSEQKKASACRRAERRKLWEKRHIGREITRKQNKKNQAKSELRQAIKNEEHLKAEALAKEAARRAMEAQLAELAARKAKEQAEEAKRKKEEDEKPKNVAVQTDKAEFSENKGVQTETTGEPSTSPDTTGEEKPVDESSKPSQDETKPAGPKPDDEAKNKAKTDKEAERASSDSDGSASAPSGNSENEKTTPRDAPTPSKPPPSSDSDSSDSPVEDWELMYSSDDMSKKLRNQAAPPSPSNDKDTPVQSDGESRMPYPWNAICIAGFRVYSKDENLQLNIVMEGGELAEGGMGEKGEADIDNAQDNAGGAREEKKDSEKTPDEVEIVDGDAITKMKIVPDEEKKDDDQAAADDDEGSKADDESESDEKDKDKTKEKKKKGKKDDENKEKEGDEGKDDAKDDAKDKTEDEKDKKEEAPAPEPNPEPSNKSDESDSSTSPINTPDSTMDINDKCKTQSKERS